MNKNIRALLLTPAFVAFTALAGMPTVAAAQEDLEIVEFLAEERAPSYESSETLINEFKEAFASNDLGNLADLLGLETERLMTDEATLDAFVKIRDGLAEKLTLFEESNIIILEIGRELWPFPFPIVQDDNGTWSFDTLAGLEEIINRRVGRNELETIETARAYVDAQREYASQDRDGDGVLEYAQKLISSEGLADGLYWPESPELGTSPAGDFARKEAVEGARRGDGYFGYHYRIVSGQGNEIAGGSYDYVINDNMIAGFALIAWPVRYGETGAKTFMVSHHGTVYEADLGPETKTIVKYITTFNPDDSWDVVTDY